MFWATDPSFPLFSLGSKMVLMFYNNKSNITMLTNWQAYVQLAQINITALTNLQTCTINTDRAEFRQLKHLQATGREIPHLLWKWGSGGSATSPGAPGPHHHLSRLWKRPSCPSLRSSHQLHLPPQATGLLYLSPSPFLWWPNACVSALFPRGK